MHADKLVHMSVSGAPSVAIASESLMSLFLFGLDFRGSATVETTKLTTESLVAVPVGFEALLLLGVLPPRLFRPAVPSTGIKSSRISEVKLRF